MLVSICFICFNIHVFPPSQYQGGLHFAFGASGVPKGYRDLGDLVDLGSYRFLCCRAFEHGVLSHRIVCLVGNGCSGVLAAAHGAQNTCSGLAAIVSGLG